MLAAHEEKQQCQSRSSLEWATARNAESSWSSSEADGNALFSDEEDMDSSCLVIIL